MSIELYKLHQASKGGPNRQELEYLKTLNTSFVPTLDVLKELFARLPNPNTCSEDEITGAVELLPEKVQVIEGLESFAADVTAYVLFRKFKEGNKYIWIYIGSVKL